MTHDHSDEPGPVGDELPDGETATRLPTSPAFAGHAEKQLEANLRRVRERLTADALAAGLPVEAVHELLDESVSAFADASVRDFIPILVERSVRVSMAIPRSADPHHVSSGNGHLTSG